MTRFKPTRQRVLGWLRVLGVLLLLQVVGISLWLRSAAARGSEALLSAGAELSELAVPRGADAPRSLFLNGVTIHFRTASTSDDVPAVLDRFRKLCRERAPVDMPEAAQKKLAAKLAGGQLFDGVLRRESAGQGMVACIDTLGKMSVSELLSRLQRFQQSGNLSDVGELRYALARRVGDKTSVLMAWTEGSLPILSMFPKTGDAPGSDPIDVPRAPGARRLLSTWENGEPYSLALYSAAGQDQSTLEAYYRQSFARAGWTVTAMPLRSSPGVRAVVARRGARTVVVRLGRDPSGTATISVAVLD